MLRVILTYTTLAAIVLWLALSYVPRHTLPLPNLTLAELPIGDVFQWALLFSFVMFVAIQVWLLRATVRMTDARTPPQVDSAAAFGLKRSSELFWTVIPLIMTIGLALVSYQTWLSLASP